MSDDLHPTRLYWCAATGRCIVQHDGVEVRRCTRPPVLLHVARLAELEYLPGTGHMYVQDATSPRRDMQDGEAAECLAYLRAVAAAGQDKASDWRPA